MFCATKRFLFLAQNFRSKNRQFRKQKLAASEAFHLTPYRKIRRYPGPGSPLPLAPCFVWACTSRKDPGVDFTAILGGPRSLTKVTLRRVSGMAIGFFASIEICYSRFNRLTQGFICISAHPHPAQIRTSRATSCLDVRGFPPIARLPARFGQPQRIFSGGLGAFFLNYEYYY